MTEDLLTVLQGDAMSRLPEIESESVQCCVTSPPYLGLRDYGLSPTVWGGDFNNLRKRRARCLEIIQRENSRGVWNKIKIKR